jgi:hypothetical protein
MAWDRDGNWIDEPDPYSNYEGATSSTGAWGYDPDSNSYLHGQDGSLGPAATQTDFAPTVSGLDDGSQFNGSMAGLRPFGGTFNAPTATRPSMPGAPGFNAPKLPSIADFRKPDPFNYEKKFVAPTAQSILQDPSFEFRKGQGAGAIINNQAASGLRRGGAAIKGLIDYNQQFASNEYKDIWNRDFGVYQKDYENAASEYDRTYKQLLDEFGVNRETKFGLYDRELQAAGIGYGGALEGYRQDAATARSQYDSDYQHAKDEYEREYRQWQDEQDAIRWTYDYEAGLG